MFWHPFSKKMSSFIQTAPQFGFLQNFVNEPSIKSLREVQRSPGPETRFYYHIVLWGLVLDI